ncbi:hypothetical protein JW756_03850 [Candidatus Woesearchaeota archaeon]|nr:hypothetical protein [Candidatus Woesearchaeota archaeon]
MKLFKKKEKSTWSPTTASPLEKIVKYAAPIGVIALETPLHEGLHALTAKVLPQVGCSGVVLSQSKWYAPIFKYLTLGFYKTADLPANVAGYAQITHSDSFLGNLGQALTSAAPEIATMTLGLYWIKKGIENISEKSKRLYSMVNAYCGLTLTTAALNYMNYSTLQPEKGQDHVNFTEGILKMFHLPASLATYVTFLGSAAMFAGSLYLTRLFSHKKDKDLFLGG